VPSGDGSIFENGPLPSGATVHPNADGEAVYGGPCPAGGETRTYNFMVFALKSPSALQAGVAPADALTQLTNLAQGDIAYYTGTATGG
jgi:phosphatidylethanolamine-binding protein (PEBP) family uncharacterized protein